MKNYLLLLLISIIVFSCKKEGVNKEVMMENFVKSMKTQPSKVEGSTVVLTKTEKTGNNEITLHFETGLSEDNIQPQMISDAIQDLMVQIIKRNSKNIQLLEKGVNFKVILAGKDGKELYTDVINKSSMTAKKPQAEINEKHNQLNQMLEISNANLPITDSTTGITITKIALGNNNDVIYTAEVPEKMKSIVKIADNRALIKKNMSTDKQFKQMLIDLKNYDISTLKYEYRDKNGTLLQHVEMQEKDFK